MTAMVRGLPCHCYSTYYTWPECFVYTKNDSKVEYVLKLLMSLLGAQRLIAKMGKMRSERRRKSRVQSCFSASSLADDDDAAAGAEEFSAAG